MSIDFSQNYDAPVVTASMTPMDEGEFTLRPKTLRDYTGQEKAKENLAVYIEAARRRAPGPCAALRPSGPGQDHPGRGHRQ